MTPDLRAGAALTAKVKRLGGWNEAEWAELRRKASEIVVFGSRAANLDTRASDLDLLIVLPPGANLELKRNPKLDLVLKDKRETDSASWLTSELAGHISAYGRWIEGEGGWREETLHNLGRDFTAAEAKRRRIERFARALRTHWDSLTPEFRARNLITLRRENQRLALLEAGKPIPPTRTLDAEAGHGSLRHTSDAYAREVLRQAPFTSTPELLAMLRG